MNTKEPHVLNLAGVAGPDAHTVVAENGAKQSFSPFRPTLFPPYAFLAVSEILSFGAEKYGDWNWLGIEADSHLDHMLVHTMMHILKDDSEGLLGHLMRVATRANMALHMAILRIVQERKGEATVKQVTQEIIEDMDSRKGKLVRAHKVCGNKAEYSFVSGQFFCRACNVEFV